MSDEDDIEPAQLPFDLESKRWIERRLEWLVRHFGWRQLENAEVILPAPEFFPDEYAGSPVDVRRMLDRVCEYMGVEPNSVAVEIEHHAAPPGEEEPGEPEEGDGKRIVKVADYHLEDPLGLVATLARELARVKLLGRTSPEDEDYGRLCDLTTIFFGMGVITANAVIREKNWFTGPAEIYVGGWTMRRLGQLSIPAFGYALALIAWTRHEGIAPSWANELRPDVRAAFDEAAQFLEQTGDAQFGRRELPPSSEAIRPGPQRVPQRQLENAVRVGAAADADALVECRFCAVKVDPNGSQICPECQQSIDENERAQFDEDAGTTEDARFAWKLLWFSFFAFLITVVAANLANALFHFLNWP